MTDVRLTCINPEDGSIVPVAGTAKGELKLEEPITFDGNLDGDLTVSGTGLFGGGAFYPNSDSDFQVTGDNNSAKLTLSSPGNCTFSLSANKTDGSNPDFLLRSEGSSTDVLKVTPAGNATFLGSVRTNILRVRDETFGFIVATPDGTLQAQDIEGNLRWAIESDGATTFAGNKAGFTEDGNLWCTTQRGDTVILDATQNGLGSWAAYTPSSRSTLKEKFEELRDESNNVSQNLPGDE